jgi:uncharacterized delta-60 repeat protein
MNFRFLLCSILEIFISSFAYSQAGSLDSTFGNNGIVVSDFGDDASAYAIAIQPDDKIVIAGIIKTNLEQDFLVARYHSNGSIDMAFGNDGIVIQDMGGGYLGEQSGESSNSGRWKTRCKWRYKTIRWVL